MKIVNTDEERGLVLVRVFYNFGWFSFWVPPETAAQAEGIQRAEGLGAAFNHLKRHNQGAKI